MRRNAAYLLILSLVLVFSGCKSKDKDAELGMMPQTSDYYARTAPIEPAPAYESYDPYVADATPTSTYAEPAAPSLAATTQAPRYHTVVKRDTLYSLARKYYNDQRRWKDIYEANRSEISDPNRIYVGQRLVIP
jgi:nucleoid-associated protein YgaU